MVSRELGARHVAYGAETEHYPVVGEVLLASMAEIAGPAWTQEYERAWAEASAIVAGATLEGAESAMLEARRVDVIAQTFADGTACPRELLPLQALKRRTGAAASALPFGD